MMTGNELAVALERNLPIKILLSNNGAYGSILLHQRQLYPERFVGTSFVNPDFRSWATAFRCRHFHASSEQDLRLMPRWLAENGPAVFEVESRL